MAQGKRLKQILSSYEREQLHPAGQALGIVQSNAKAKFDETIELSVNLGIDDTKADQKVRGTVSLPGGTGKAVRVAVLAQGDKAKEARDAGADEVGDQDLAAKIKGGWTGFDVVLATPEMMPIVGKELGPVLKKLTPSPKSGTVTNEIGKAVREFKGGKVEYRNDKFGNVHAVIGKASFDGEALAANYLAMVDELQRVKPSAAKGKYFKTVTLSSTMGPGVRVDPNRLRDVEDAASAAASAAEG